MEQQLLRTGLLGQNVRRFAAGKLNVENDRDLGFPVGADQRNDGLHAGLTVLAAAGKGRVIAQAVGRRKVAEGETVAENDQIPLALRHDGLEALVQRLQLLLIGDFVLGKAFGVFRGKSAQLFP